MIKRSAKINMTFVPFPGTAPAINTLMGGHVTAVFADYPTVVRHILKSGTLRGLVTASAKRNPALPDVPTFAEAGIATYDADIFYGIVAPAKTPPEALKQLSGWFSAALKAPEVQPRLAQQGLFPVGMCGAPFGDFMRRFDGRLRADHPRGGHKGRVTMIRTTIVAALLARRRAAAQAAEIKVISANGMREVIAETKARFEAASGHKLNVTVVETGAIRKRVLGGEAFDVIMVPRDVSDAVPQGEPRHAPAARCR